MSLRNALSLACASRGPSTAPSACKQPDSISAALSSPERLAQLAAWHSRASAACRACRSLGGGAAFRRSLAHLRLNIVAMFTGTSGQCSHRRRSSPALHSHTRQQPAAQLRGARARIEMQPARCQELNNRDVGRGRHLAGSSASSQLSVAAHGDTLGMSDLQAARSTRLEHPCSLRSRSCGVHEGSAYTISFVSRHSDRSRARKRGSERSTLQMVEDLRRAQPARSSDGQLLCSKLRTVASSSSPRRLHPFTPSLAWCSDSLDCQRVAGPQEQWYAWLAHDKTQTCSGDCSCTPATHFDEALRYLDPQSSRRRPRKPSRAHAPRYCEKHSLVRRGQKQPVHTRHLIYERAQEPKADGA